MLEGWKLYHNPNIVQNSEEVMDDGLNHYKDVEGNSNRDLWKSCAISFCKAVCVLTMIIKSARNF